MHPCYFLVVVLLLSELAVLVVPVPQYNEGDIRLVGGRYRFEGTVLIYHQGEWGSICDRYWSRRDANVVCHQLGYIRAYWSIRGSAYGVGSTRRWLSSVRCRGRETRLQYCTFPSWGIHTDYGYCHDQRRSAGVMCHPRRRITTTTSTTITPSTTTPSTTTTAKAEVVSMKSTPVVPKTPTIKATKTSRNTPTISTRKVPLSVLSTGSPAAPPNLSNNSSSGINSQRYRSRGPQSDEEYVKGLQNDTKPNSEGTDETTVTPPPMRDVTNSNLGTSSVEKIDTVKSTSKLQTSTATPNTTVTIQQVTSLRHTPTVKQLTTTPEITVTTTATTHFNQTPNSFTLLTTTPAVTETTTLSQPKTTVIPPTTTTTTRKTTTTENIMVIADNPNLRRGVWKKDKLLDCYVFLTRGSQILLSRRGGRPSRMSREEYIKKRWEVMVANRDMQSDSTQDNTGQDTNSQESNGNSNTINDEGDQISTSTNRSSPSIVYIDIGDNGLNNSEHNNNIVLTSRGERQHIHTRNATTKSPPSTATTTTSTTTTTTPTTTTTTTPVPSTTPNPTTTTTIMSPQRERPTTIDYDINDPFEGITLRVNRWAKDRDLDRWVLLTRSGQILIAKAGDSPTRISQNDYRHRRRAHFNSNSLESIRDNSVIEEDQTQTTSAPAAAAPIAVQNLQVSDSAINNNIQLRTDDSGIELRDDESNNNINENVIQNIVSRHRTRHRHGPRNNHSDRQDRLAIRLAGGRTSLDGRIEVLPPGEQKWGVVCGDKWSMRETIVACRHLRNTYGLHVVTGTQYGGSNKMKYFSSIECTGKERSLRDCKWKKHEGAVSCSMAGSVAGVICANALPDLEPNLYMLENSERLQDRPLYYLQCAMEENCLAPSANNITSQYDKMRATRRLLRFSSIIKNIGTADFRPKADRSQWEWHACHMHYHSMDVFAHYDILDSNGNRVAQGLKASFCLEDSACTSGHFPKYECQNYGHQGISVGCSDNYLAEIDCQWVDVTDLKPGSYKFKMEVNPDLLVAELSFDNNVVVCDLYYPGHYANIYNCQLKSLL